MPDIVIVGGGFAGLWAALAATRVFDDAARDQSISLVSKDGFLTLRPRLYERDPARLREPLRPILDTVGVAFEEGTVVAIQPKERRIVVDRSEGTRAEIGYERLILATGSVLQPLPVPGADKHVWDIDTYAGAIDLDRHLRRLATAAVGPGRDCVVIIGAGFTGIELATEMRHRLAAHWGDGRADGARIVLVEMAPVIGPDLGERPRPYIEAALGEARIDLRLGTSIDTIGPQGVVLSDGEHIHSATAISTAGLRASPLAALLTEGRRDDLGRLHVDPDLKVEGVGNVYATGDIARAYADKDHLALMSCQHAITMGKAAGANAARECLGLDLVPYRQPNYVTCLDLGVTGALFSEGWDRQVRHTGDTAKRMKHAILTERIYPPRGNRADILAATSITT